MYDCGVTSFRIIIIMLHSYIVASYRHNPSNSFYNYGMKNINCVPGIKSNHYMYIYIRDMVLYQFYIIIDTIKFNIKLATYFHYGYI